MTTDPPTAAARSVDVVIVGAGPAGCAAGVFCARADLDTVIVADGRSTLQKCAYVENYLGFPAGIEPRALLELSREHAREAGCERRDATVETIRQIDDRFEADTDDRFGTDVDESTGPEGDGRFELVTDDGAIRADHVIATSWSRSSYLDELGVETDVEDPGAIDVVLTDEDGRTNVDGVYAAGRITGTHHQALVNAGDGARVALTLLDEIVPDFYNDWVAPAGYYAHYDREVPVGVEEIDHDERRRRVEAGRERMRAWFGDES